MKFAYYPGCSLHATGRAYDESIRSIAGLMNLTLEEIDDWNCCGATAYMSVNEILSFSLSARNLALAAKRGLPVVAPCSACYTNLRKTEKYLAETPDIKRKVNEALAAGGLRYDGGVVSKHLLQVVVEDVGLDKVRALVKRPLVGLKVAPYYGCQIARPFPMEESVENPVMLDRLLEALGAVAVPYAMKTVCCGGALMGTREEVALRLCRNLLLCAQQQSANCIAVTCPLCQMNVDTYQGRVNEVYGTSFNIPVVYFTQLMGVAFGVGAEDLGLNRCTVPPTALLPTGT
ncbi:MAG: CoB--CoM heterodisulfide reductase iron-sulfur subunit B family protein [Candidatus Binatia bacterium]|jgi:heterodisulfide reductase subunit B2